jgi:glyoxylase-like metal-dependent hydrolase (beta-lactamase superfamily II)
MGYEAPIHEAYFDSVDRGPIRYILLTQGHVDHVGGVDVFREAGTEIVAHANSHAQQAYDARLAALRTRLAYCAWAASIDRKRHGVQARPQPTITFTDRHAFTLGGVRFELIGCGGAETEDSTLVCFTGNVFGALFGHFPNLVTLRGDRYRDALRYVETLDTLLALDAEMLLVGHFDPIAGRDLIRAKLTR